jgi:hypothetical protein
MKLLVVWSLTAILLGINMGLGEKLEQMRTEGLGTSKVAGPVEEAPPAQPQQPSKQAVGGLPEDYVDTVWFIESSRGTIMESKTSSAKGHFQFIDRTWNAFNDKYKLGFKPEDRFDFEKSKKMFSLATQEDVKFLRNRLKREPTYTEKYMAFKLGMGTAGKFLAAPPNRTVDKVLGEAALKANRQVLLQKCLSSLTNDLNNKKRGTRPLFQSYASMSLSKYHLILRKSSTPPFSINRIPYCII